MTRRAELRHTANEIDIRDLRTVSHKIAVAKEYSASQNDLDLGEHRFQRVQSTGAIDLTGILAGVDGREYVLINTGANNITIKNNSASSEAANRILTGLGTDLILGQNGIARFIYDETISRWRGTAKEAAPGPGPGSFVDTINSVQEDGAGNIDFVAATGYDIGFTAGTNQVIVEPPDWHHFTLPPTNIGASAFVVFGTLVIPAGKKVDKVLLGVRRSDDTADSDIEASVKNETSTEELASDQQYPTAATFSTTSTAGQRLVISVKNDSGTARDVFAEVAILLQNA